MNFRILVPGILVGVIVSTPPLHSQSKQHDLAENKKVAVMGLEAWNKGDTSRLTDFIAEKGKWWMGGNTFPWSPQIEAAAMKGWLSAFPDTHVVIDDVIAEGDRVVLRTTWTGIQKGVIENIPPTGRAVRFSETVIYRFESGKMVEVWVDWDELGMYRQLGVLPPGSPRPSEIKK